MVDLNERKASSVRRLYGCQSGSGEKPLGFSTSLCSSAVAEGELARDALGTFGRSSCVSPFLLLLWSE